MVIAPPKLIEPIQITVEQIDKTETEFSGGLSGRREPLNSVVRKTVSFPAQVVFGNTDQITDFSQLGPDEQSQGYLVVRYVDLKNLGITLRRGDKIVQMGTGNGAMAVELYLLHTTDKPGAQFSSLQGFSLARVPFGDRNPVG